MRDLRTGRVVARLDTGDFGRIGRLQPGRRLLAIGRYGGTVAALSTRTWKPVGRVLDGHEAR